MNKNQHHRRWVAADLATALIFVGAVYIWWQFMASLPLLLIAAFLIAGLFNFIILHLPEAHHSRGK